MKKLVTSLLLLLFLSPLLAQTLVRENNQWSGLVEAAWPIGEYSFHFQKLQGDTTIGNKTYKKLLGKTDTLQTTWDYEGALREEAPGKVYHIKAGSYSEHLIYDFDIKANDIFTGYYDETEYKMIVDSIKPVQLLNGEWRKQYYFTGLSGWYGYENWIEEIGSDNGLTNSGVFFVMTDYFPSLNCFTENGIVKVYNNNNFPCYSFVSSPDLISSRSQSEIIPNPVVAYATVRHEISNCANLVFSIYSLSGVLVKQIAATNTNPIYFSREGMDSGMYMYTLRTEQSIISSGKFLIK